MSTKKVDNLESFKCDTDQHNIFALAEVWRNMELLDGHAECRSAAVRFWSWRQQASYPSGLTGRIARYFLVGTKRCTTMNQDKPRPPTNTKGATHHQAYITYKVLFVVDQRILLGNQAKLITGTNYFDSNVQGGTYCTWKQHWGGWGCWGCVTNQRLSQRINSYKITKQKINSSLAYDEHQDTEQSHFLATDTRLKWGVNPENTLKTIMFKLQRVFGITKGFIWKFGHTLLHIEVDKRLY